jgi:hypothetical protein
MRRRGAATPRFPADSYSDHGHYAAPSAPAPGVIAVFPIRLELAPFRSPPVRLSASPSLHGGKPRAAAEKRLILRRRLLARLARDRERPGPAVPKSTSVFVAPALVWPDPRAVTP